MRRSSGRSLLAAWLTSGERRDLAARKERRRKRGACINPAPRTADAPTPKYVSASTREGVIVRRPSRSASPSLGGRSLDRRQRYPDLIDGARRNECGSSFCATGGQQGRDCHHKRPLPHGYGRSTVEVVSLRPGPLRSLVPHTPSRPAPLWACGQHSRTEWSSHE